MTTIANQIADLEAKIADLRAAELASGSIRTLTTPKTRKAKAATVVEVRDIKDRDWTRDGVKHEGRRVEGQHADIVARKSIRLFGVETNHVNGPINYDRTFKVGDTVVTGSYNLTYTGPILAIGAKTVTVKGVCGRTERMSIYSFNSYNNTMNLEDISRRNAIESQCI